MILNLCERFHCLPSALLEEDMELLRLLEIRDLGLPPEGRDRPDPRDFRMP